MFKSIIATTEEIDNPDDAVAEILDGIDLDDLLPNTAGYLFSPIEYFRNGTIERLQKELPFPVACMSNMCTAANGVVSPEVCILTVLTGDDIYFKSSSFRVGEDMEKDVRAAASSLLAEGRPTQLFLVGALSPYGNGDVILSIIDDVTGGVPLYGTTASDCSEDNEFSAPMFVDGEKRGDTYMLMGIYGNIKADFHMVSISKVELTNNFDFVTKADHNRIYEINDRSAIDFLESINMAPKLGQVWLFRDEDKGSAWLARAPFGVHGEEDYVTLAGNIPEKSRLCFGVLTSEEVMDSCKSLLREVKPLLDSSVKLCLMNSCITRLAALVLRPFEYEEIADAFEGSGINYFCSTSGGEFCPVKNEKGEFVNAFHNITFTVALFRQIHD